MTKDKAKHRELEIGLYLRRRLWNPLESDARVTVSYKHYHSTMRGCLPDLEGILKALAKRCRKVKHLTPESFGDWLEANGTAGILRDMMRIK